MLTADRGRRARLALAAAGVALAAASMLVLARPAAGATCLYEAGSVSIRAGDETVVVQQDGTANTILVNGADCSPAAPVAETTTISISGGTVVEIAMADTAGATIDWGAIDWSLRLGSASEILSTPADLVVDNADGNAGIEVTAGASGIDLDTDGNLDVTYSGVGVLRLVGGPAADTLSGMGNAATGAPTPTALALSGGTGDDRLTGGAEDDALDCGDGVDWLDYSASPTGVTVDLAAGTATGSSLQAAAAAPSGPGADTIAGCENVAGSAQADTVTGDANANRIAPGLGNDTLDGGDGFDVVGYDDAPAAVVADLVANTVSGGSGSDTLAAIEGATGSGFGDRITGSELGNVLVGGAGADTVLGLAGDDTLDGGSDTDRVIGGDGEDTCILDTIQRACEPTLRVETPRIEPGGSPTVSGNGWYPENGPVEIQLLVPGVDPQLLATVEQLNDAWGFERSVEMPDAEGTYRVQACQPCDSISERRSREVVVQLATVGPTGTAEPAISLSQNEADPGDRIHVLGAGWDPDGGKVRIFLEPSASEEPIARAAPEGPNGEFDQFIDIPEELEPGSYTVVACRPCGGAGEIRRTAELTIPAPVPWIPIVLGLAAAAAVGALVVRRLLKKKPVLPPGKIGSRLELGEPDVHVEAAGNGRARHSVRLVPRRDPGVQRVEERSPS